MPIYVQASVGEYLARPLLKRLEIDDISLYYQLQFADVLEAIEQSYAEERGYL